MNYTTTNFSAQAPQSYTRKHTTRAIILPGLDTATTALVHLLYDLADNPKKLAFASQQKLTQMCQCSVQELRRRLRTARLGGFIKQAFRGLGGVVHWAVSLTAKFLGDSELLPMKPFASQPLFKRKAVNEETTSQTEKAESTQYQEKQEQNQIQDDGEFTCYGRNHAVGLPSHCQDQEIATRAAGASASIDGNRYESEKSIDHTGTSRDARGGTEPHLHDNGPTKSEKNTALCKSLILEKNKRGVEPSGSTYISNEERITNINIGGGENPPPPPHNERLTDTNNRAICSANCPPPKKKLENNPQSFIESWTKDFPSDEALENDVPWDVAEEYLDKIDHAYRVALETYVNYFGRSPIKWLMQHDIESNRFKLAHLRHANKTHQELR